MSIKDIQDQQEKRKMDDEYKNHQMTNLADSINRAMIGDLSGLTKGGCLTKVITTVIIIGILFYLLLFNN